MKNKYFLHSQNYMIRSFLVLFFILGLVLNLIPYSSAASVAPPSDDAEIKLKAKKKLYPGGKDEESLKVQTPLLAPLRKKEIDYQQEATAIETETAPAAEELQD